MSLLNPISVPGGDPATCLPDGTPWSECLLDNSKALEEEETQWRKVYI